MILRSTNRAGFAITLVLLLVSILSIPFVSANDLGTLEDKVLTYEEELYTLTQDLYDLAEEIALTEQMIELTYGAIYRSINQLAEAQEDKDNQIEAMRARIRFIYEADNVSILGMLLAADSIADFLNAAEFIQAISEYDRMMLFELQRAFDNVEERMAELEIEEVTLAYMFENLTIKHEELEAKAEATATDLESLKVKLAVARSAETEASQLFAAINIDISDMEVTHEVRLLAAIIHTEARGEPFIGQVAIGNVIINRTRDGRFPDTIEEVIRQPGQFCPVRTGAFDATLLNGMYQHNLEAAFAVIMGYATITSDMVFFNSLGFGCVRIGNHWFRAHY